MKVPLWVAVARPAGPSPNTACPVVWETVPPERFKTAVPPFCPCRNPLLFRETTPPLMLMVPKAPPGRTALAPTPARNWVPFTVPPERLKVPCATRVLASFSRCPTRMSAVLFTMPPDMVRVPAESPSVATLATCPTRKRLPTLSVPPEMFIKPVALSFSPPTKRPWASTFMVPPDRFTVPVRPLPRPMRNQSE